jgi:hypothetical protein
MILERRLDLNYKLLTSDPKLKTLILNRNSITLTTYPNPSTLHP